MLAQLCPSATGSPQLSVWGVEEHRCLCPEAFTPPPHHFVSADEVL